jgi:arylsulfatase A-like enzyme/glycerophosphoryl diester phosphodiesterase
MISFCSSSRRRRANGARQLRAFARIICVMLIAASSEVFAADARPNVIFILADDLGYGDLGCYGQKLIRTPHIDELAREGTRFTQVYAGATVCAPSRCALMTGKHGGHAYIRGNRELKPEGQEPMPADTKTVAHLMKQAGYATALIGKWGLGKPESASTPGKMGFDYFFGYNCQTKAHEYYPEYLWRNDEKVVLGGRAYSHDLLAEESLEFVRKNRDRPFFLYLAFTIPHLKLQVPDLGPYGAEPWPDNLKKIAAMITRMDRDVGRLMSLLKELGLDEKTLVMFASDNGATHRDALFQHSGALRGFKRDMYEGGIRVPLIARWPGRVAAGQTSEQVWAFWDFLPTMAELVQQPAPQDLDGISVLPALLERKPIAHPPLYWEFHERGFDQAARIDDWKAVRIGVKSPLELYDLKHDPGESHNVAPEHPEVVAKFENYLRTARVDSALWPIREKSPRPARARQAQGEKNAPIDGAKNGEWNVRDHVPLTRFVIQSHRGAGDLAPENTIEAFELGWKLGTYPEADVRTTKDGMIVAFHDNDFSRVVKGISPEMAKKGVVDVTFAELQQLDVGAWKGAEFTGRRVSKIADVFARVTGHPERHLYLDIKNVDLERLAAEVKRAGVEKQVVLASPKQGVLREWKTLVPSSDTLLWMPGTEADKRKAIALLRESNFDGITQLQIHVRLPGDAKDVQPGEPFSPSRAFLIELSAELAQRGILFQALPYGAKDPGIYAQLLDAGVASFATDHPEVTWQAVRDYYTAKTR